MNFIPPFARRVVPSQNYPDYALFDFDHITYFELRFVRSAPKRLALWFVVHPSILLCQWKGSSSVGVRLPRPRKYHAYTPAAFGTGDGLASTSALVQNRWGHRRSSQGSI
jgi:hypothetical protein